MLGAWWTWSSQRARIVLACSAVKFWMLVIGYGVILNSGVAWWWAVGAMNAILVLQQTPGGRGDGRWSCPVRGST